MLTAVDSDPKDCGFTEKQIHDCLKQLVEKAGYDYNLAYYLPVLQGMTKGSPLTHLMKGVADIQGSARVIGQGVKLADDAGTEDFVNLEAILASSSTAPHGGMKRVRPPAGPPPAITVARSLSVRDSWKATLARSRGGTSSSYEFWPSPRPPGPWHWVQ